MKYLSSNHGGNIREAAERYGLPFESILDFSANINPLGLSPNIKEIIASNIDLLLHYPDTKCKILKNELADFLNLEPSNLLIGNGSIELIYLVPKALSPCCVLIPIPTFSEYEFSARRSKGKAMFIKTKGEENFQIKIEGFIKFLPKADLVFLCNPNNPTGNLISKDEIIYLAKAGQRHDTIVAIDEVFIDFVKDQNSFSVVKEVAKLKNLLVLRSLTKFFALPGLRLGYLVANKNLIARLSRYQFPWNVNSFAQLVGRQVIKDKDYIKRSKELIFRERDHLFRRLKEIKSLYPYIPTANFIFCRLDDVRLDSRRLCDKLGRRGILVRDCSNFRGLDNKYIRIAVRKRQENNRLINALRGILR